MVASCHSSAKRSCRANIWLSDKAASHFLHSSTLEWKHDINQKCHSGLDGHVIAMKWDLAKCQTKFCIAPHTEALWIFVLKLWTFQQLEYFLVASWWPGLWLSCRTRSNGSMDAWVIGLGKWSRQSSNISKPNVSPMRTCCVNIWHMLLMVPGCHDQKASMLAQWRYVRRTSVLSFSKGGHPLIRVENLYSSYKLSNNWNTSW
jgi:hypothetical protein